MEALDNPSYFSLPGVAQTLLHASSPSKGSFFLLKRREAMGTNTSSAASTASTTSPLLPTAFGTKGSISAPTTPTAIDSSPCPPALIFPQSPHRRSFRSLLRSNSQNPQLFVLGEPRPADVAPLTPNLTKFKIDHPRHRKRLVNKTAKSAKSSAELINNDMVFCPLSESNQRRNEAETLGPSPEEISLGKQDARYYNLTAATHESTTGRRRHSIGTFFNKERYTTRSLPSTPTEPTSGDFSQKFSHTMTSQKTQNGGKTVDAPLSSTADWCQVTENFRSTHSRRRCNRCASHKARTVDMEDILILSSKQSHTAGLWVNYLTSCFEQISKQHNRAPFKILSVILEDIVGSTVTFPPILEEKMVHVKLQIVIMCPQFLEHVYQNPGPSTSLGQILKPDRVLAMMLGVDEDAVTEQHRAALISYPQWSRLPVTDQDATFVKNFIEVAMNILAKVWRQTRTHSEKSRFSLLPKKVKEGQNKVIVLLNEPISKEDKIKVTVDKNGDKIDILTMKRKNPYTLHFQMPDCCLKVSMIVNVYVEKNGEQLGCRQVKCESRMRELDQILRSLDDPLLFMCQTLGFSPGDREHLDNFLVSALQRNIPKHFNLLHTPMVHHRSHTSNEEYPTLLHFSARFGLEKLSWQLLECPGGEQACEIRNICEMTPAEMAEGAGHIKLANALRGYMQMTELTSMYSYLKRVSEANPKVADFEMTEYHSPRPISETYLIPPSMPRPVTNHYEIPPSIPRPVTNNYQVPPIARPFSPTNLPISQGTEEDPDNGGYMKMHASAAKLSCSPSVAVKDSIEFMSTVSTTMSSTEPVSRSPSPLLTKQPFSRQNLDQVSLNSSRSDEDKHSTASSSRKKSREQLSHEVQDDLIEIINDFKNNVFTISEVEKLVESWRNRNDVQQSFKEKQEQLTHMREQYERIQAAMKEEMKRATPFDRIRNFFRGKPKASKPKEHANDITPGENKVLNMDSLPLCLRPLSSLSLHSTCSSSSSGRMSTVSGCSGVSLGDSGTHSDIEDRKQAPSVIHEGGSNGISTYDFPPAPRPVTRQNYNVTTKTNVEDSVKKRPPQPPPRPETPEYLQTVSEEYTHSKDIENTKEAESSSTTTTTTTEEMRNSEASSSKLKNKVDLPVLHIVEPNTPSENTIDTEYMNIPISPSPTINSSRKQNVQTTCKSSDNIYEETGPSRDNSSDFPNYINITTSGKEEKRQSAPRTNLKAK